MRVSGLTLMGARVVGGGGIEAGGSLATVVGCSCSGGGGTTVGVTMGATTTDVLTVAGTTGTDGSGTVSAGAGIAGDVGMGIVVDDGAASVGVMICGAGRGG